MARRAYWSGQIRLSLVSIPVQVVQATRRAAKISFHQVHKPTGSRIRYQKVVPGVGPVDTDEIVKGYEVEKDKYVLLSNEELDELKLEAKRTIDLVQFVDQHEIDPMYFERPFFVLPDEESDAEAFVVLREALRKSKRVGLGQMVVRGKGSVVAVKACGRGLLLESLRYADELRKVDTAFDEVPDIKPEADLIGLAEELIERKTKPFEAEAFKDAYTEAVRELINAKAERRPLRQVEERREGAKVVDLMDALRQSVGRDRGGERRQRRSKRSTGRAKKTARRGSRRKAA